MSFAWLAKKNGLTEEEVADMNVRYNHADLDRSGQLDRDELKVLLKSTIARQMSDPQLELFLKSQWHNVDKDGNGKIDFEEFLALYSWMKTEYKRTAAKKRPAAEVSVTGAASATGVAGAAGAALVIAGKKTGEPAAKKSKKKKHKKKKRAVKTYTIDKSRYPQNYISSDILWSVVRKHHSFLVKRDGARFSAEPGNLRNEHKFRNSGLVHSKSVDISAGENGVLLTLSATSARKKNKPKQMHYSVLLKKDSRPVARRISAFLNKYRPDLKADALARMTRVKASLGGVTKKTQKTANKKARRTNK